MLRIRLLKVLILTTVLCACQDKQAASGPSSSASVELPSSAVLLRVEAREVCMVNDEHFGKAQIPVAVAGKTYFGCCPNCKEKLENDASARTGTDPVSGKPVDKASAVIGRLASGKVLYFESEENLRKHAARL